MSKVSIYLNFQGKTEDAFNFYKKVFRSEFVAPIAYMKDVPASPDLPALSPEEGDLVMHVSLPIFGAFELMGTDSLESMGQRVVFGNNVNINLQPDTKEEADRLFSELSERGKVEMPMQMMFWGDYFGAIVDQFGVCWMINQTPTSNQS